MRVLLAIALGALLSGCIVGGAYNFSGPGTVEDFAKARSQCCVSPRLGAFEGCMNAKGYFPEPDGRHSLKSIADRCH